MGSGKKYVEVIVARFRFAGHVAEDKCLQKEGLGLYFVKNHFSLPYQGPYMPTLFLGT